MAHPIQPLVPPGQTALILQILDDPWWRQIWVDYTLRDVSTCLTNDQTSSPVVARVCHIAETLTPEDRTPIKYVWMHEEYSSILDNLDYQGDIPDFMDYRDSTWDWWLYPDPRIILVDTDDYDLGNALDQNLKEAVVQKLFEFVSAIRVLNSWHIIPSNAPVADEWDANEAYFLGKYIRIGGLVWIVRYPVPREYTVSPADETGPFFYYILMNGPTVYGNDTER